jgi:hypothetical protein
MTCDGPAGVCSMLFFLRFITIIASFAQQKRCAFIRSADTIITRNRLPRKSRRLHNETGR